MKRLFVVRASRTHVSVSHRLNLGDRYINKNLMGRPWRVAIAMQDDGIGYWSKKLSQNQLALLIYWHRRPKPIDSRLRGNDGLGAAPRFDGLGAAPRFEIVSKLDFTQNLGKVMDDITFVRSHWWLVSEGFSLSTANSDVQKLPATLYHRIADSLAYAA